MSYSSYVLQDCFINIFIIEVIFLFEAVFIFKVVFVLEVFFIFQHNMHKKLIISQFFKNKNIPGTTIDLVTWGRFWWKSVNLFFSGVSEVIILSWWHTDNTAYLTKLNPTATPRYCATDRGKQFDSCSHSSFGFLLFQTRALAGCNNQSIGTSGRRSDSVTIFISLFFLFFFPPPPPHTLGSDVTLNS